MFLFAVASSEWYRYALFFIGDLNFSILNGPFALPFSSIEFSTENWLILLAFIHIDKPVLYTLEFQPPLPVTPEQFQSLWIPIPNMRE